jgi:Amt family ammonium transporter
LTVRFGWYGFNCCSTAALGGQGDTIGLVAVNTTLGAAFGGITAIALTYYRTGEVNPGMGNNGILAGLVSITAGCACFEPYGAVITGIVGGFAYVYSSVVKSLICRCICIHFLNP